jgi:hypothetical protein
MRPQTHLRAQAKDRVLQRRTTLKDEEPDKYPPLSEVNPITHIIGLTATRFAKWPPRSVRFFPSKWPAAVYHLKNRANRVHS